MCISDASKTRQDEPPCYNWEGSSRAIERPLANEATQPLKDPRTSGACMYMHDQRPFVTNVGLPMVQVCDVRVAQKREQKKGGRPTHLWLTSSVRASTLRSATAMVPMQSTTQSVCPRDCQHSPAFKLQVFSMRRQPDHLAFGMSEMLPRTADETRTRSPLGQVLM